MRLDKNMNGGEVLMNCSIATTQGVKVPDVVWMSAAFVKAFEYETPYPVAPEICVEVLSPSNSERQMREKIDLYLAKGAKEVWTCDDDGKMKLYDHAGEMKKPKFAPKFPAKF
ncbi:MAG: Uma2 family endonuclease, partial [Rhizobacter sp.]|nr:Uma2 family endonuclease [Chlorobiales bacterium]